MRSILLTCALFLTIGACPLHAEDVLGAAEQAYLAADYDLALSNLSSLAGLLEIAPIFDQVQGENRERVLFDLARCRFALGDSSGARVVLGELFRNDPNQSKGTINATRDDALGSVLSALQQLRRKDLQARIDRTSSIKAAIRSAVLPGWGQQYRGRRQRCRVILASFGTLAAGWFIADRAYRSAMDTYRRTSDLDLNLPNRTGGADDPDPFTKRFQDVESKASRARTLGIALASVWVYSVLETLVLQPGRVAITIPMD